MSMIAKNRIHSQWTPLSNEETNNKIFEERKGLVSKWFGKWNDAQRRQLYEELVASSKRKQLEYVRELVDGRVPCHKDDFTRYLPRCITLYVLSFLDARSLCQCAQVCWYWRYLSELDQLWHPKCMYFGWPLPFTPSPYENGVWKRNFSEQFKIIKALLPKEPLVSEMSKLKLDTRRSTDKKKKSGPSPWRGSDPVPKDTWRYNYLNNDEVVAEVSKKRQKSVYGSATDDIVRNARSKVKTGNHVLNTLARSSSLTPRPKQEEADNIQRISSPSSSDQYLSDRPRWARQMTTPPDGGFVHKNAMKSNGLLSNITRPAPVAAPTRPPSSKSRPTTAPPTQRSARDPPTSDLFPQTPWKVPVSPDSDDDPE